MQDNENINLDKEKEEGGFSIRMVLGYLRAYWKLFVISFVVCIAVAFVYLRRATPVYNVTAKVLLQDSEKGGAVMSPADMLADFGVQSRASNVENEIELMSSMTVVRGAVIDTDLYVKYSLNGSPVKKADMPFSVAFDRASLANIQDPLYLDITVDAEGKTMLAYSYGGSVRHEFEAEEFPCILGTVAGDVNISRNDDIEFAEGTVSVVFSPIDEVASRYKSRLSISPLSKTASVAELSYNTPDPKEGVAFLNAIMESFNTVTNDNKRQVARRTEAFISERLKSLKQELEEMESSLAAYKKQNELISPELDVRQVSQKKAEYVKLLEEIDLKIEASKYLNDFVNDPKNDMQVIPASFGVDMDPALVSLINNYNVKVLDRKTLLQSTTEENPALKNATVIVRALQDDLRTALQAVNQSLSIERKAVAILADKYTGRFEMSPEVERQLLTITRECTIKSDLYVMLLQKYEETLLSIEVQSDNLSCIDAPYANGIVSPNKRMIYLIAMFMGLLIPVAIIYIRVKMRNKFATVDEVQEALDVPYIGSIPAKAVRKGLVKETPRVIVVEKNKNDVMAEAFRTLRTNLQFVMKKSQGKVVMFTSTVSGEGKTFLASNLAVSTVLLGQKVLLVGCDIRRPRLAEIFNFSKANKGLTSYLAADENEVEMLDKLIVPSNVVDGLDILPAGIVPPNPAELLSGHNLDRAIEYLRGKYDRIILDAAPVGLVADSMIVSRVADAVAYVVRLDFTHKADATFIASLIKEKKLENVAIVVNGEDLEKKTYSSSRGSSRYSSYGYTYTDELKKK